MSSPNVPLRVFFLEDNQDDVDLELYELQRAGYSVVHEVAQNRKELLEKLPRFPPDIILADYSLPDITGIEAIAFCADMNVDVPVILITGEGNEQMAVDSLRLGAIDYIIKRNITGLPARVARALEIWKDRKEKKRVESEEKRLQQLLFENQKMEAVGRLTSGIAHDFNNLLTGIMGYADLGLKDAAGNRELTEKLESIISFSRRGADFIKQLLIFSRKVPMEFEPVNFNSFVRETATFLKRIIEETIEIQLDLREGLPEMRCDTRQFTQVLMNLALNARDAMGGKGVVTIRTDACRFPEDAAGPPLQNDDRKCICLSVSDTGTGIEPGDLQRIFEPFFTTKRHGTGTGLGLSIVYAVVNAHGGTIRVTSEPGRGTTFIIYLPPPASHEQAKDAAAPLVTAPGKQPVGPPGTETVLIAEDEDLLRKLAVTTLTSLGYTVVAARDGIEALDVLKSGKNKFDLIISDMMMPKKDGVQLFQEVRAIDPRMKFIMVTGYSLTEQSRPVLEQMDAILTKPFTSTQLARVMREVLDK